MADCKNANNKPAPVCVSIYISDADRGIANRCVLKNRLTHLPQDPSVSFASFYKEIIKKFAVPTLSQNTESSTETGVQFIAVHVGDNTNVEYEVSVEDDISITKSFAVPKFVQYNVMCKEDKKDKVVRKNAFDILMTNRFQILKPMMNPPTKKTELHNSLLSDLQGGGAILKSGCPQESGHKHLSKLTDAIWYLDGRQHFINNGVKSRGADVITPLPVRFQKYTGFQNWQLWKKKPRMDQQRCKEFSDSLVQVLQKPIIHWPTDWERDILAAASSFSSYAKYLQDQNDAQKEHHSQLHPTRELSEHAVGQYWPSVPKEHVHKNLVMLSSHMEQQEDYHPVLVDDEQFPDTLNSFQIYYHLRNIALAVPVQVIRYDPGGGSSVMTFMYKVPENIDSNERLTVAMRILKKVEPQIPVFHTRAMRKQFYKQITPLNSCDVPSHVLRHIYRSLTGDCSAEGECAEIDDRVKLAVETGDEDLILDLRHLNKGRPGDTFQVFFSELEKIVDETTAADERRHGISHMSEFLSIRDLIQRVKGRVPDETPIPSEATVLYAFAPPNIHKSSSQYYTGKINLKHVIQRRQLRAFHSDAHWCNALFRYMREMAIMFRHNSLFLSCDDKAKVDFGEPGLALSSGVRGKKSIVPTTSTLAALDHDVSQKGSITPTITMMCDIPQDISQSFYSGKVAACLKDSVFQPSDSFRTILELIKSIEANKTKEELGEIRRIFMITDGGPEHRVNFDSVKIPLILLFKHLNLDMLVAIRTAPGHSYTNIVERIMSIFNIGFQNIALQRESCPSDDIIKKCNNLEDLRKHGEIKDDWHSSVQPMINKLEQRIVRLALKGSSFVCTPPATDQELDNFIQSCATVSPQLPELRQQGKLNKAGLASNADYQRFLNNHCRQGHYAFQVRRCDDTNCCPASPADSLPLHWLPYPTPDSSRPGHYMAFKELYGHETEELLPSVMNSARKVTAEQQGCPPSTLTAQNVRHTVKCTDCNKTRCIYSACQMTQRQIRELNTVIRKYDYICGCQITPDVSSLAGTVFTRLDITCESPVEWSYYGATKVPVHKDMCASCGVLGADIDQNLLKAFKTVLPLCSMCKSKGKNPLKRGPIHTPAAKRAAIPAKKGRGKKAKK